jgi:hypothetical protein
MTKPIDGAEFEAMAAENKNLNKLLDFNEEIRGKMVVEWNRCQQEIADLKEWQQKVCAIVQPAQTAEEWGMDVADIIASRIASARQQAMENERLQRVAVLADKLTDLMAEFPDDPSAYGEFTDSLIDALNAIGDERLAEMKYGKASPAGTGEGKG